MNMNMNMKNIKVFVLGLSLIFIYAFSCTNEVEMNKREYIIENDTDYILNIKFYQRYLDGTSKLSITSKILNKKGSQLNQIVEQTSEFTNSGNSLFRAYQGDSVIVIFNNNKFITSSYLGDDAFSEPLGRNLYKHSNYENLGNEKFIFKITQQDYENAEDCNGNCD